MMLLISCKRAVTTTGKRKQDELALMYLINGEHRSIYFEIRVFPEKPLSLSRMFFFQCHIAFILLMPTILNIFVSITVITKIFKMVGISSMKAM